MRIGLSILTYAGHSIWNNGIGQNVLHLAELLDGLPFVERVVLLDCGDQRALPPDLTGPAARFPVLTLQEAEGALDVAVEMAGGLDPAWAARLRARGGRVVWHICGQPHSGLIEPAMFGKPGYWSDPHRADDIWILPKDEAFAPMLRGLYRSPVHVLPYLWSRQVLDASLAALGLTHSFGYRTGSLAAGARIAVFEPNISPIKTCLPPMLLCDVAARQASEAVASLILFNASHLAGRATFDFAFDNLTLMKAGRVETRGRDYFARAMGEANMVVSHQLECTQNYLYLDALAGDYPLIHNSPLFRDVGYYYPDTDLEEGARQVLRAWREHDVALDDYRARSRCMMETLHPANPVNKAAYARRLLGLTAPRRSHAA